MRLFIAVDLGEQIKAQVGRELPRFKAFAPDAKWVRAEAMHITLAFLGHLPDEKVPEIRGAMERAASRSAPAVVRAQGVGGFGSSRRPRVLWVGLGGDVAPLISAQSVLEGELIPLGYQPEKRAFQPHLTLARAREPQGEPGFATCVLKFKDSDFGETRIDRLILFKSELSPKGARYTALSEAEFGI